MSSPDLDYLRRLRSLDLQLGSAVGPSDVARVDIVSDRSYMSSRERAPLAYHQQTVASAGIGLHNGYILGASDLVGGKARLLVHNFFMTTSVNVITGLAPASSLTFASGPTLVAPLARDNDPEVSPLISWITIATANIPAAYTTGWTHPQVPESACMGKGFAPLPLIECISPDLVLIVISNAPAEANSMRAQWQAVRL